MTGIIFGATLAVSLALPIAVAPLLRAWGIIDVPNERSSHSRPVIRGMGLAVLIAVCLGLALATVLMPESLSWPPFATVGLAILASGLLGLAEDLKGLPIIVRSVLQLGIGVLVSITLVGEASENLWGVLALTVYGVLFISSFINVANFMDGLNGISGFHGVVAGVTFALCGVFSNLPWLLVVGGVFAAAFAGFLPWNLRGNGVFLGDVGSYLLGGGIAVTSIAALFAGVPILATIGPMILYFADSAATLVRRTREGKKWYLPHKEHGYQRINQLGYSHVATSLMVAGLSLGASAIGLLSYAVSPVWWLLLLALGLVLTAFYLKLPSLLPERHARVA